MFLYKKNQENYDNIKSVSFGSEREIQNIVEKNTTTLLNLEFIESEFTVEDFRLDSIRFDNDTNSFVIIEYKLDKNHALTDQGYSYLNTMLNNKSKFVLALSKKRNELLEEKDFNWRDSRVIFISQTFSKYQINAYATDLPFELIRIKKYDSDNILLDHVTPKFKESYKVGKSSSDTSINNKEELTKMTEGEHLRNLTDEDLLHKYAVIKERILDLGPYEINVTASYIGFRLDKFNNLVTVKVRKNKFSLDVVLGWIYKDGSTSPAYFKLDDPKNIAIHKDWNYKSKEATGYSYYVTVDENTTKEDLEYIVFLINQKHTIFENVKI